MHMFLVVVVVVVCSICVCVCLAIHELTHFWLSLGFFPGIIEKLGKLKEE